MQFPGWEIEFRVIAVAAEESGIAIEKVGLNSKLIDDLGFDSLAIVEFLMALEEEFRIGIPDETASRFFMIGPETLLGVVGLVEQCSALPFVYRPWMSVMEPLTDTESVPATQIGGRLESPYSLQLVPIGKNREGFDQHRRTSDGMRCVEISPGLFVDAEPVSNAAYARFLNSIQLPKEPSILEWFGAGAEERRLEHQQLNDTGRGWSVVKGAEMHPIVLVSWFGANAYSLWAHGHDWTDYKTRGFLPTEAEWLLAADGVCPECAVSGRHVAGAGYSADSLPTQPVNARRGMSRHGLHHMLGNVWQWCSDEYLADDSELKDLRVERGGSWVGPAELASVNYRRGRPASARGRCLGFRCASHQGQ